MLPDAKSKKHSVSPLNVFASRSACCKAKKPEVSTDKWPYCPGQKEICSFSFISLQPSVSTGKTEPQTSDQHRQPAVVFPINAAFAYCSLYPTLSSLELDKRREKCSGHSWHLFLSLLMALSISTRMAERRSHPEQKESHDVTLHFISSWYPSA